MNDTDTDISLFDNNSIINQTEYTTHSTFKIDIASNYIMNQKVHNTHSIVI